MSNDNENVDFLNVDNPVPGQNFVCLSFLSPESVIKKKDTFILHEFLKKMASDYNLTETDLIDKFEDFKYVNEKTLTQQFSEENDFLTNCRGVKIRGVYDTKVEAEHRAKLLQKLDKNHSVFIGQIGYWLPWDPSLTYLDDIDGEYLNNELNTLMKKYKENQENKDIHFQNLVAEKTSAEAQSNINKNDPWLDKINNQNNDTPSTDDSNLEQTEDKEIIKEI